MSVISGRFSNGTWGRRENSKKGKSIFYQKSVVNEGKLKKKILEEIKKFNEIREPEAVAELVEFKDEKFLIKFSGHMCFTCGTYDYFDDLKFELEGLGIKTKIKNYKRLDNYFLVEYKIYQSS